VSVRPIVGVSLAGLGGLVLGFALGRSAAPAPVPPVEPSQPVPAAAPEMEASSVGATITVSEPRSSLVFHPFLTVDRASARAVSTAELVLRGLETGDAAVLRQARDSYLELEAVENFGGEYPTLRWLCDYLLAEPGRQRTLLENDDARRFVDLFGRDEWALLEEYIAAKYGLGPMDRERLWYLDEIVRFNSPYRGAWERSERVLELLELEPGMEVADVGAGAGFYSFRFADRVGSDGQVYALEMNDLHLAYLRRVAQAEGLTQLAAIATDGAFPDFPEGSLDRVFLCATYQSLYLSVRDSERAAWLEGVRSALAPDGLLVVVDNEPVLEPGVPPFGGISLSRSLVQAQLEASGFELVAAESLVPQRYALVLRKATTLGR